METSSKSPGAAGKWLALRAPLSSGAMATDESLGIFPRIEDSKG